MTTTTFKFSEGQKVSIGANGGEIGTVIKAEKDRDGVKYHIRHDSFEHLTGWYEEYELTAVP